MATAHSALQNHLLAALPGSEYDRLLGDLELIAMPLGEVLYESGSQLRHVYFPTTCIVSLLYVMEDCASAEIAVVGMKESSASRCSWAGRPIPAEPLCKVRDTPIG